GIPLAPRPRAALPRPPSPPPGPPIPPPEPPPIGVPMLLRNPVPVFPKAFGSTNRGSTSERRSVGAALAREVLVGSPTPLRFGSSPLGFNPFGSNPLGSSPFGSNPLGSSPFGSNPLGSSPLDRKNVREDKR